MQLDNAYISSLQEITTMAWEASTSSKGEGSLAIAAAGGQVTLYMFGENRGEMTMVWSTTIKFSVPRAITFVGKLPKDVVLFNVLGQM